jgi:aryl-alcohol dehydrogenase-like predicted oxidoreductase
MPLARLAVAWMLAEPAITAPIVGASRPDQLDELLAAPEKPIDALLKSRLDEITREYRWGDDPR